MRITADLHLHSKYSRATSPDMNVSVLDRQARRKGIQLLATGDFTHPKYLAELKDQLVEDGSGFSTLSKSPLGVSPQSLQVATHPSRPESPSQVATRFALSTEIACIYKDKGKCRRIHMCYLVPDFATADKVVAELEKRKFNLRSDGRPIIGLSAKNLSEIFLEANEKSLIIPAHIWTPWFALFGSKSGYDQMEDCFEALTPHIYAVETGLSSDPPMNWRVSDLDKVMLISNSDSHSPANIGREANVFEFERFDYDELFETLKNKDTKKFIETIEFFPEEGRYHVDGHAACGFACSPSESIARYKNLCPKCGKSLVLGVEHRVEELADRPVGFRLESAVGFRSLVPLQELIAESLQQGKSTKAVQSIYESMIDHGGSELNILLNLSIAEIQSISNGLIAEAIRRVRAGEVVKIPGYDGEYGHVTVFAKGELAEKKPRQSKIF